MALKSTIFKATLSLSDTDRHLYNDYPLTLARHPSETDERMMSRILAFALHAHEQLAFGKGISNDEEPALWQKNYSGDIELWIEVGMPTEERLRKACSQAQQVICYAYGLERNVDIWWKKIADKLERFEHLSVIRLPHEATQALAAMAQASMQLQCTITEGDIWMSNANNSIAIHPAILKGQP